MKRFALEVLAALALLAPACMRDMPSPVNDPDIPLVSVDQETMTRISATLNGSVGDADGIVSYGFEMTGTNFDDGSDIVIEARSLDDEGRFSQTVEVQPGAFYAVRSFISNGHHKKYSNEITLRVPSSSVATPSEVTIVNNRLYAGIVDDGGRTIREVGFCWGEVPDNKTIRLNRMPGQWLDDGTFSAVLPSMEKGQTFYFLAYAENASDAQEAFGYSTTPCQFTMTGEQYVEIEDEEFRQYLIGRFDKDRDGGLTAGELGVATDITVSGDRVASVQGIEYMPLLESLSCRGSEPGKGLLNTLDISHNPLLASLSCDNNRLSELDLSGNPQLAALSCAGNQLTRLDLTVAGKLYVLDCSGNRLESLDVSQCFRLAELDCSDNLITDLVLARTPYLRKLIIRGNPLESLDVSYCDGLEQFDGTGCPQLEWVFVSPVIYDVMMASGRYSIDETAVFYPIFIPVPDAAFNDYLLSVYDTDGDRRISASEAAYVTRIDICSDHVETMSGIEFFYNLEELNCASCSPQGRGMLTELDVSHNRKLTHLDCHGNRIDGLDLSHNGALTHLDCSDNQLDGLDLSGLTSLGHLDCSDNELSGLDVSGNRFLTELDFGGNEIDDIDLSNCPLIKVLHCPSLGLAVLDVSSLVSLVELDCSHNLLETLDVSNNFRLETLWCEDNLMTWLDVSNNIGLSDLRCDNVDIPDEVFKDWLVAEYDTGGDGEISIAEVLDINSINVVTNDIHSLEGIEYFINLETLVCRGEAEIQDQEGENSGQLSSIDVSHNTKLRLLDCRYNRIFSLDLSHNPELRQLICIGNWISELDLSHLPALEYLDCAFNDIPILDLSHNPLLSFLQCQYMGLTELDISYNPLLTDVYCSDNSLETLDLSNNTELVRLDCTWNMISELEVSNCAKLESLDLRGNNLASLDVSGNPLLSYLDCRSNPDFYELWLKEGQEIETLLLDDEDIMINYK